MLPNRRILLALLLPIGAAGIALAAGAWLVLRPIWMTSPRMIRLGEFFNDPARLSEWAISAGSQCPDAPFRFPADGYVGFFWGDSFRRFHRHTGLDIFGIQEVGATAVYAAYPGYLTRLPEWKSTVIIRVPSDPLRPGRPIWTYYTHMADPQGNSLVDAAFPPGTSEKAVEAGALLGRMGNYSGEPGNPTGVHLHFSIVLDDGSGKFRDERVLNNTLDPSPYFGRALSFTHNSPPLPPCQ